MLPMTTSCKVVGVRCLLSTWHVVSECTSTNCVCLRHTAFNHLIAIDDKISFKYWTNETMPAQVAHRYVCIPHVPGFWDHVLVGTRTPPNTEKMIGPDYYLPKLFNVALGSHRFHWCCFVLKTQIILAMWCTTITTGVQRVFPLVDNALKRLTENTNFRRMVFYLSRWFTAQYVSPAARQLKVVLDCKPSEGTLVHLIATLALGCGMESVHPVLIQRRSANDYRHYALDTETANALLTRPPDGTEAGAHINIVDAFNRFNGSDVGLPYIYTGTQYFSYN